MILTLVHVWVNSEISPVTSKNLPKAFASASLFGDYGFFSFKDLGLGNDPNPILGLFLGDDGTYDPYLSVDLLDFGLNCPSFSLLIAIALPIILPLLTS